MSLPEAKLPAGLNDGKREDAPRPPRRALLGAIASAALLAACGDGGFRPLYGSAGIGANVDEKLAQVHVTQIPGRVGQRIRNELIFQSTGGGKPLQPAYRLEVAIRESVTSTLVQTDGDALGQIYTLDASFQLIRISDNSVALKGISYGRAGFERFDSIFSNVRAREDAENRAARTVGEELKSRLTAYLAGQA
jgi:LPS-assembly lipoprotein